MSAVAISRANTYDSKTLGASLEKTLALLGDLDGLFRGKIRVFIKANLLSPFAPVEKAIFTHPNFVREVVKFLKNWNVSVVVGDDISFRQGDAFSACGYRAVLADLGVELSSLKEKGFREIPVNGEILDRIHFSREALEADCLLNLPKLKTHSFTIYTGAVKNIFGLIPHGLRLKCHREHIWNEDFSNVLVDIFSVRPPDLNIMDAVVAMEGEGPSSGNPREVGLILASRDAVALDAVAGKIIGLAPELVFTTRHAYRRELGLGKVEEVKIKGEPLADVLIPDFKLSAVAVSLFRRHWPSFLYAYFQEQLAFLPRINRASCTGCADCQQACPAEAINMVGERAFINLEKCIHCLCCHEICRFRAVHLGQRPLGRVIRAAGRLWHRTRTLVS